MNIYHEILYRPILNLLVWFYNILPGHDVGLAIIGVTLVIRLVLYPSFRSSLKSQKALQELQPKMDEVKQKHKDDKQAQMAALMELYKEHKVNPLSACLPLLIQLPVLIALFQVLNDQLPKSSIDGLYAFIANPGSLDPIAFGAINLAQPHVILAAVAAILQFVQTRMLQPKRAAGVAQDATAKILQKQMLYFLPFMTFVIALRLPAGLPVYWAATTIFAILQQWVIIKSRNNEHVSPSTK